MAWQKNSTENIPIISVAIRNQKNTKTKYKFAIATKKPCIKQIKITITNKANNKNQTTTTTKIIWTRATIAKIQ